MQDDTKLVANASSPELVNKSIEQLKKCQEDKNDFINITELVKLTNVGIRPDDLSWARTKMNNEHCICVRHTSRRMRAYRNGYQKNDVNNSHQQNGRAKFFLNEDELTLSSSYESRKDYQLNYDKYSNGHHSLSSERSDDSCKSDRNKCYQTNFKKNSLNSSKNFFLSNNFSVYKSENNLDNNNLAVSNHGARKLTQKITKSNSFNNLINNYRNGHYKFNHSNENSLSNSNQNTINHYNQLIETTPRQPRFIPQWSTILYLISPYDARVSRFSLDYIKIAELNPISPFIAVATNHSVHTINLRTSKVIATTHLDEIVDLISWLSPIVLAIVTSRTVYHWHLETNNTQPVIIFFKSPKMYNCQVTSYEADDTMSWFALSSLYLEEDAKTITGLVQIHHMNEHSKTKSNQNESIELDSNNNNCFQQCIEAHCVRFARIKFDENTLESTTLIAIKKTSSNTMKIYIIEFGPLKPQNNCLVARTEMLRFNDNLNTGPTDLPLHSVICFKLSLIYIISKYGRLIVADLQTGIQLNDQQVICEDVILSAKLDNSDHQSVVLLARNGQVLLVEFDFERLIKRFANDAKLKKISKRLSFMLTNVNDEITRL